MNTTIERYLNQLRRVLGHMEATERDAVLAEVQDHLEQETERLLQLDSSLSESAAMKQAIDAFGPAKDLGIAYGGKPDVVGIINQTTGERLLEVANVTGKVAGKVAVAGGRGLKGLLKFTGIAALVILGIGTVLAVAALMFAGTLATVYQDDIREAIPRPLYGYSQSWGTADAATTTRSDTFDVGSDVKEFWIDMGVYGDSGCARIELIGPTGNTAYDSGNMCGDTHSSGERRFTAQGEWTVRYTFAAFDGSVDVESWYFQSAP